MSIKLLITFPFFLISNVMLSQNISVDSTYGQNLLYHSEIIEVTGSSNSNSDNSLFILGRIIENGTSKIAVYRVNPAGTVDNNFGTNGRVLLPSNYSNLTNATIHPFVNGGFLISGETGNTLYVFRYHHNGTQDLKFGNQGVFSQYNTSSFVALKVLSDSRFILVYDEIGFDIFCFTISGDLDSSFGNNGRCWEVIGPGEKVLLISTTNTSGFLVMGHTINMGENAVFVVKYDSIGNKVFEFERYPLGRMFELRIDNVIERADGNLMFSGKTYLQDTINHNWKYREQFFYRTDGIGNPNPNFGNNGYLTYTPPINAYRSYYIKDLMEIWNDTITLAVESSSSWVYLNLDWQGQFDTTFAFSTSFQSGLINYTTSIPIHNNGVYVLGADHQKYLIAGKLTHDGVSTDTSAIILNKPEIELKELSIFPNPVQEQFILESDENGYLVIYDITGKIFKQVTITPPSQPIEVASLPNGSYILRLTNNQGEIQTKIFTVSR